MSNLHYLGSDQPRDARGRFGEVGRSEAVGLQEASVRVDPSDGSWFWPPAAKNAGELAEFYRSVPIPDGAIGRFGRAYKSNFAEVEDKAGRSPHIPALVIRPIIRAAMIRSTCALISEEQEQACLSEEVDSGIWGTLTVGQLTEKYRTWEIEWALSHVDPIEVERRLAREAEARETERARLQAEQMAEQVRVTQALQKTMDEARRGIAILASTTMENRTRSPEWTADGAINKVPYVVPRDPKKRK